MRQLRLVFFTDLPLEPEHAPVSRLLNLARICADSAMKVTVVGCRSDQVMTCKGVSLVAVPIASPGKTQAFVPFHASVRAAVRSADGVVVRGYWLSFFVLLQAWIRRNPLRVLDFHGSTWRENGNHPLRCLISWFLETISLRMATHILSVSEGCTAHVPARMKHKVMVLENGVDKEAFQGVDDCPLQGIPENVRFSDRFCVAIVAHFGITLELETVRNALPLLAKQAYVVIIGDGQGLDAASFAESSNVFIAGRRSQQEVRSFLMHQCDAAIVPYNHGCEQSQVHRYFASRKVREYLAAGLPILAPDIPGLDSVIQSEENALVFKPGDAADLARQIDRLVENPEWMMRLRESARSSGEMCDWRNLVQNSGFLELCSNNLDAS